MKYKSIGITLLFIFFTGINASFAEEKVLSKEEATVLFKDKTFDGYRVDKDKKFKVYSSPEGFHEVQFSNGNRKSRFWRISDEGEHCVSKKYGKKGRCSVVKSVGGGVYHKITNGDHTHTLSNFVKGDQL